MVSVAQLVVRLIVVQVVAGSSPVLHPIPMTAGAKFDLAPAQRLRETARWAKRDISGTW